MKILITGGSGMIGTALTTTLLTQRHEVIHIGRHPSNNKRVAFFKADLRKSFPEEALKGVDAVIHLAGKNVLCQWNKKNKQLIYESRVIGAERIAKAINQMQEKPRLISASAMSIYLDPRNVFPAKVCVDWEAAVKKANTKTLCVRTAPVLSATGGFLKHMLPFFKWGLGGKMGSGQQILPWIHLNDIVNVYVFALNHPELDGSINAVAPEQVTNEEFTKTLGKVLHRPTFWSIPRWALRLRYGEMEKVISADLKVRPGQLLEQGFKFEHPYLEEALRDLLEKEN